MCAGRRGVAHPTRSRGHQRKQALERSRACLCIGRPSVASKRCERIEQRNTHKRTQAVLYVAGYRREKNDSVTSCARPKRICVNSALGSIETARRNRDLSNARFLCGALPDGRVTQVKLRSWRSKRALYFEIVSPLRAFFRFFGTSRTPGEVRIAHENDVGSFASFLHPRSTGLSNTITSILLQTSFRDQPSI